MNRNWNEVPLFLVYCILILLYFLLYALLFSKVRGVLKVRAEPLILEGRKPSTSLKEIVDEAGTQQ